MQKKIGNIVTDGNPGRYPDYFNVVSDISGLDMSLPTIIIGYNKASSILGEIDTTDRKDANTGFMWTFGRMESRSDYETDMDGFTKHCMEKIAEKVSYKHFDLVNYRYSSFKKIIRFIDGPDYKMCHTTRGDGFVFIYCDRYNTVFGLSLTFMEWCGIGRKKVIDRIKSNKKNWFVYNLKDVLSDFGKFIGDDTHLIPVLSEYCSNDKKQNN